MYIPLKSLIQKCISWFASLRKPEATEQETQDYIARLERAVDELTIELDYQKDLAKAKVDDEEREREN